MGTTEFSPTPSRNEISELYKLYYDQLITQPKLSLDSPALPIGMVDELFESFGKYD
jgi:hypothetical protein